MALVKICGITNIEDALAATDAGADLLGFVCDEHSSRYVGPETCAAIAAALPLTVTRAAVFHRGGSPAWRAEGKAILAAFDKVQYASDAIWSDIIGENWDMRRKIKAFPLQGASDLLAIAAYNGLTQSYLVNVHAQKSPPNTSADEYGWSLARQVSQFGKRVYLAGGLTRENVERAVVSVRPYAVDVTVGVESQPGRKDTAKLRDFIAAVKGA